MPISADNATFFTPSSYTDSVTQAGPKTLSVGRKKFVIISHIIKEVATFNLQEDNWDSELIMSKKLKAR